jgi:hypothetical protein
VIFTLGYASVLFASLYLALRNGDFAQGGS